jgi:hypothetical protein
MSGSTFDRGARRANRSLPKTRLALQRLEERLAPATFLVTNVSDSGAGSLRNAVALANANVDPDTINFDPAFFGVPRTINLANLSGQLTVSNPVAINGPGAHLLTVRRDSEASNFYRVFNITRPAYSIDVAISGMTITGGALQGPGAAGAGAGVFVGNERVTLTGCVITGNTTAGGSGAGVFVFSYGEATLVNCTVTGNASNSLSGATGDGGGVAGGYYSEIKVVASTISNNSAAGNGGGLSLAVGGSLVVANSTISGNTAGLRGGAAYLFGQPIGPGFALRNTTIAANSAGGEGGAIALVGGFPAVTNHIALDNCTITGNTGRTIGGGASAAGGGIGLVSGGGTISLNGTVVANNNDLGTISAPDVYSVNSVNASFSLVRNQSGAIFPNYATQNNLPAGSNPLFAVTGLANNGGAVSTIGLQASSPLIDVGTNAAAVGVDARGNGFARTIGAGTDIGAFESGSGAPSANGSLSDGTIPDLTAAAMAVNAFSYQFSVTYTGAINMGTIGPGDITVAGPAGYSQVATFVGHSTVGNQTTATYEINAPGGFLNPSRYGTYFVNVNAKQVFDTSKNAVPPGVAASFRVLTPATFTVSSTNDAGPGSLRQAILDANARIDTADTIVFDPAVFSTAVPQTILLAAESGQLNVFDSFVMVGPGANRLAISGGDYTRVMRIQIPGIGAASIVGLTLTEGFADGDLTTNRGVGGALWTSNESVILDAVVISNSQTNRQGGGIGVGNSGSLTIRNSVVSGNTVLAGGAYSSGGGLYFTSGGQLFMENCTVSGNTAITHGGGLYLFGSLAGTTNGFTIRNSTISGNSVTNPSAGLGSNGGGIGLYFAYGAVTLQNCTITGNTVAGTSAGQGGGGIAAVLGNPTITAVSTVIAQNVNGISPDVRGTLSMSNGLVGSLLGANLPNYATQNNLAHGTNPLFVAGGPANNGGPVPTIGLQPGSPLLNAGANPLGLTTDARGSGFVRSASGGVDIGAFELQTILPPKVLSTSVNDGTFQRSMVMSLRVTFNTNVTFAGNPAAAFGLTRIGGGAVEFTVTLTTLGGATMAMLSNFTGAETQLGSLRDGRYTLSINAALVSAFGGQLDGNGDGVGGDNYAFGDSQGLFRFFGDVTGDRSVDIADFGQFSATYGLTRGQPGFRSAFDFNGDGVIDIADFGQFSIRIFTVLP